MVRSRRRSAARVIGWGAALVLYAAGLLFSVELTSGVTAQPVPDPQAAVTVAAAQESESPIATITLAATALVVVAAVRATRSARRRIPRPQHGRIGARASSPTT